MTAPSERPIRVLVVDDHPVVRAGLVSLLDEPDIQVVGEAGNGAEAVEAWSRLSPDVTLMDLRLPVMSGVEAMKAIRASDPLARVIVVTTYDGDAHIQGALDAGASGYVLKDSPRGEITDAVRTVHAGGRYLAPPVLKRLEDERDARAITPRERDVLKRLAKGLRNREIAADLGLSEATVKIHVNSILSKLKARDRTEAAAIAMRRGLVSP